MENFVVNNSANTTENNTNENIFENTIGSAKANVFALPTFDLQLFDEDSGVTYEGETKNFATVTKLEGLTDAMELDAGDRTFYIESDINVSSTVTVGTGVKTLVFGNDGDFSETSVSTMFNITEDGTLITFSGTTVNSIAHNEGDFYVKGNKASGITSITGIDADESVTYTTYKDGASDTSYTITNIGGNKFNVTVDKDGDDSNDITLQYT